MISMKPLFGYLAEHNISLKKLSEMSGVSYIALIKMRKNNQFTVRTINKICTALGVNIEELMRYEED